MITILGGSGYVGQAYCKRLSREEIPFENLSRTRIDYSCTDKLVRYLQERRPSSSMRRVTPANRMSMRMKKKKKSASSRTLSCRAATTPRSNCVLSTDKLKDVGLEMTEVREALERALRTWRIA